MIIQIQEELNLNVVWKPINENDQKSLFFKIVPFCEIVRLSIVNNS